MTFQRKPTSDELGLEHIIPKAAAKDSIEKDFGDWQRYLHEGWKAKHTH